MLEFRHIFDQNVQWREFEGESLDASWTLFNIDTICQNDVVSQIQYVKIIKPQQIMSQTKVLPSKLRLLRQNPQVIWFQFAPIV